MQANTGQQEPIVVYCAREQLKGSNRYGPIIRKSIVIECNETGITPAAYRNTILK